MTYEIGQKVETPLGVGVVKGLRSNNTKFVTVKFNDDDSMCMEFESQYVKPYKSAHEKLIEMGLSLKIINDAWSLSVFSHEWWSDDNRRIIAFYTLDKLVTVYEANHEIMRIIPQYLEEMAE